METTNIIYILGICLGILLIISIIIFYFIADKICRSRQKDSDYVLINITDKEYIFEKKGEFSLGLIMWSKCTEIFRHPVNKIIFSYKPKIGRKYSLKLKEQTALNFIIAIENFNYSLSKTKEGIAEMSQTQELIHQKLLNQASVLGRLNEVLDEIIRIEAEVGKDSAKVMFDVRFEEEMQYLLIKNKKLSKEIDELENVLRK